MSDIQGQHTYKQLHCTEEEVISMCWVFVYNANGMGENPSGHIAKVLSETKMILTAYR